MRAKSIADFISKVEGALQEIEETSYWLDLIVESHSLDPSRLTLARKEAHELTAMLVASVRTAKHRRA